MKKKKKSKCRQNTGSNRYDWNNFLHKKIDIKDKKINEITDETIRKYVGENYYHLINHLHYHHFYIHIRFYK